MCQEALNENFSVDTSQDIQSLLEPLNLPADFFDVQQVDNSYINPEPNLQQSDTNFLTTQDPMLSQNLDISFFTNL